MMRGYSSEEPDAGKLQVRICGGGGGRPPPLPDRRLETGGVEFVVVLQPDGSFACLPAWMTEPAASRFTIGDEPHFPLHILRAMRAEIDALLGFLLSDSKTETAQNGAQIRTSPTKPVRRGDAARESMPGAQDRAREPRGSSAPRDRSDAGPT